MTILTIPIANNAPSPIATKTSPAIAYPQLAVVGLGLSFAKKSGQNSIEIPSLARLPFSNKPCCCDQQYKS